ncbi:MAG: acyl-CoA mutase large subunit family protein [Bacteroidales bacterium]|nr:acyl-CoA mutase large subunit family protein [Bacteroidales bacterium]MCF8455688.1 acyl-CoA mutase large subunit family protein [Bacteroidales bacterium]
MTENKKYSALFEEFPPITTEQWEAQINKDLKGADYDKKLIWKTIEGFDMRPYYRFEDLKPINYLDTTPGEFPFSRGIHKSGNDWYIRQNIEVENPVDANKKALDVLMKGATSIGFRISKKVEVDEKFLTRLIQGIDLDSIELNFITGYQALPILDFLLKQKGLHEGSVDFAPLGRLTITGNFCKSADHSYSRAKELIQKASGSKLKVLSVHGDNFRNAGSSLVHELAFSLAIGAEYLNELTNRGLTVDEIAGRMKFHFCIGSNYFMEIAKLRAARYLWAKIVDSFGVKDKAKAKMHVHSTTSNWNKTLYDPYVNMLRTTTEAMSAIIAGTNSLTIEPFNKAFETPTEFSERIARNQQNLLKEESYLDKVNDPAGGSYYIENMTASIIDEAWKLFLEVDEKGGYLEAFKQGFVQGKIKESSQKRDMAIAHRREILLGTNQYPNFTEALEKDLPEKIFEHHDYSVEKRIAEPLQPYRGAQAFELLRYTTDQFSKNNPRPLAYMIPMGNLNMRKARAQFACNFFACAGFEVVDNNGFDTVEEGIAAAKKAKANIVVVCSSDDEYATLVPEINKQIGKDAILVVAGAPACMEELKAQGIENFIHVKVNVLEELKRYQGIVCC